MATAQTTSTKQTGKQKAAAEKAAAAKAGKQAQEKEEKALVPVVKKGALSLDVGPKVVTAWRKTLDDEAKGEELIGSAKAKRYDLLAQLTHAIVKAATADKSINLAATTIQGPEGSKAMNTLNDQLYQALGLKVVVNVQKGDKQTQRLAWNPSVAPFFPAKGEDPKDPAVQQKHTLRTNLATQLKKCAMSALGIIDRGITAKIDNKAGTLLLSGPAVKKTFGVDSVHLDERQTVPGKKTGEEIKLKEKPSFTAIAAMAAEDHGMALRRGSNTRGRAGGAAGSGTTLLDPNKVIQSLADSVVKACETIKQPNDVQIEALEKMQSAIEKVLDNR